VRSGPPAVHTHQRVVDNRAVDTRKRPVADSCPVDNPLQLVAADRRAARAAAVQLAAALVPEVARVQPLAVAAPAVPWPPPG
jgi:hypothetical protein